MLPNKNHRPHHRKMKVFKFFIMITQPTIKFVSSMRTSNSNK